MPNGKPNPFITSIYNRSDITSKQYNQKIKIFPTIVYENPEKYKYDSDIFNLIIEVMIEQFKSYFAGDIGWKDSNGNLIEGDPSCRYCSTSGYLTK